MTLTKHAKSPNTFLLYSQTSDFRLSVPNPLPCNTKAVHNCTLKVHYNYKSHMDNETGGRTLAQVTRVGFHEMVSYLLYLQYRPTH